MLRISPIPLSFPFKKIASFFFCFIALTFGAAAKRGDFATIVVDYETGKVLQHKNADEINFPASITKVMTLYLLFEQLASGKITLNSEIRVSKNAADMPPVGLNLKGGEVLTVDMAIKAMVVRSANDVAAAVGEFVAGGSESQAALLMTRKARELGMQNTVFKNASGLPDPEQVSTAADLAILGRRTISDFPQFYPYFATENFVYNGVLYNGHNRVMGMMQGVDGMKTGYTNASGYNLLTSAEVEGKRVVAVVLGGETGRSRDLQMVSLLKSNLPGALVRDGDAEVSSIQYPLKRKSKNKETTTLASTSSKRQVAQKTNKTKVKNQTADTSPQKWAIQVGSYKNKTLAEQQTQLALKRLPAPPKECRQSAGAKSSGQDPNLLSRYDSGFKPTRGFKSLPSLKEI